MKRFLLILFTLSFYISAAQYGECLINSKHNHCCKQHISEFQELSERIESKMPDTTRCGTSCIVLEIGDWDMDVDASKIIAHGLTPWRDIRSIKVIIRDDADSQRVPLSGFANQRVNGGAGGVTGQILVIYRLTMGVFDNRDYDQASYNRGWIYIIFE